MSTFAQVKYCQLKMAVFLKYNIKDHVKFRPFKKWSLYFPDCGELLCPTCSLWESYYFAHLYQICFYVGLCT